MRQVVAELEGQQAAQGAFGSLRRHDDSGSALSGAWNGRGPTASRQQICWAERLKGRQPGQWQTPPARTMGRLSPGHAGARRWLPAAVLGGVIVWLCLRGYVFALLGRI